MFYRRKLILAILEVFGGKLPKINLQKLLFIVAKRQTKPAYDFVPYKFGCFSYSANADLKAMIKHGYVTEDEVSFIKKDKQSYLTSLNDSDRRLVNQIFVLLKNYDADALMKHTYINYPYYAIHSTTAPRLLSKEQLKAISAKRPSSASTVLFTIGYEGISLEAYLNKLIKADVQTLVDVRNNPLSQKYGFSKSQLETCCKNLGIEYLHIPEVGIQSEERQELKTQKDYDTLFDSYKKNTLTNTVPFQEKILNLLIEKKRIALTCFEANICQCHRKPLAEAVTQLPGWNFELKHI
jgi:uncharacterized protein (DUF488 family)